MICESRLRGGRRGGAGGERRGARAPPGRRGIEHRSGSAALIAYRASVRCLPPQLGFAAERSWSAGPAPFWPAILVVAFLCLPAERFAVLEQALGAAEQVERRSSRPARRGRFRSVARRPPLTLSILADGFEVDLAFEVEREVGQFVSARRAGRPSPSSGWSSSGVVDARGADQRARRAGVGGELRFACRRVPMWALSSSSPFGSVTETACEVRFAGLALVSSAWIAGWPRRLRPPVSFRLSFGANGRIAQLATW